ncbi:MAG: hypothetical protein DCC55_06220 [Chloroflexi bacterium]|nr:MAG: hypothetical protein DCC55_06220 [Chloroflexota bacterium]
MTLPSDRQMAAIRQALNQDPTLPDQLPAQEGEIVRRALAGEDIHRIAQQLSLPEAAIWEVLGNAARLASGQGIERVETAGLGSDTDPGVTGGYGDTAFGSLGNEPPFPTPEEPSLGESDQGAKS